MHQVAIGTSWTRARMRAVAGLAAVLTMAVLGAPRIAVGEASERLVSMIVRELPGAGEAPERLVETLGGSVGAHIGIIDGFVAAIPEGATASVRSHPGVLSVTPNHPVQLQSESWNPQPDPGSLVNTARVVGAADLWRNGITGEGVDVAVIDTGVVPVDGLTWPGKVINGPDLSFESGFDEARYLDTYGHGTHIAGIIAGRDNASIPGKEHENKSDFLGIAPDARILNVKVANAQGVTDVSQVLAAIDWVVQHRNDNGMNVRVLNLSFGTDGVQDYRYDPLTYAVEVAWRKGITVIVAAGNAGFGSAKLNNPAYDPFVISVGSVDTKGSPGTQDDIVPSWSSTGDGTRNPDIVAPGKSIVSLRDPGSYIDQTAPSGYVSERFFRGSGTSQSAAVVSGAAALLLEQRPDLTPDQIKAILRSTATPLPYADPIAQGKGELDVKAASAAPVPASATQPFEPAYGTGSLEGSRGSLHVQDAGGVLEGEQDIFGNTWDGQSWSGQSWSGQSWSGGEWMGQSWSGQSWSGQSWSGQSWSGQSWSGQSWS